jgi:hypothetical protein
VFLERALLVIFERQTADEKADGLTEHENGVGFTGTDAEFLTKMAKWVLDRATKGVPEGKRLCGGQVAVVRKAMMKYHGQLAEVAKQKNPQKYSEPQLEVVA